MNDLEKIIKGCKEQDSLSQKRLYDLYSPRFYALCLRYASNAEDAKDILSMGFLQIFSNIESYKSLGSFEGWMQKIMIRTAIHHYKKNLNAVQNLDYNYPLESHPEDGLTESRLDIKQILKESLNHLKPEQRIVFNMVAIEGYTLQETSQELGVAESTIKSRFYSAKEIVGKIVKEYLR